MKPVSQLNLMIIPVTEFQQNCTLLWAEDTKEGVFIDAGGEADKLMKAAEEKGVKIREIWLTHGHLDHAGGANEISRRLQVPVIGPHKDDEWLLQSIPEMWANYGLPQGEVCNPDKWLEDGDMLELGGVEFNVVHCPGHTPGHVAIISQSLKIAFVGDLIFQGSIGRTDFPKGNHHDLINSITQKLWPFGNDVKFIPGHGSISSFGRERQTNPFVGDAVLKKYD